MKKKTAWSIYVFVCMILLLCGSITVHAKGVYEEPGSISSSHNWANPVKCHTFTDECRQPFLAATRAAFSGQSGPYFAASF